MQIHILTLFPEMFFGPFDHSIISRAKKGRFVEIHLHDLREWTTDKHRTVDMHPYGGGPGMVFKVDVIDRAVEDIKSKCKGKEVKTILLDAAGKTFDHKKAVQLTKLDVVILICGHYEGVDFRVSKYIADETLSVGNFVVSGGEIPAMIITDAIVRLIPGVIDPESLKEESFSIKGRGTDNSNVYKEYPQYTRPEVYKGWKVPKVLLSGNHSEITNWRSKKQKTA